VKKDVRKQDKAIIWPAYFDLTKTRKEGRRVQKSLAVQHPKIDEVKIAVEKLGLEHEFAPEAGYPKTPWLKAGRIMVEKKGSKEQVIVKIAKQLLKMRSENQKQQ
jgi:signal recognition particle subunit SRP19